MNNVNKVSQLLDGQQVVPVVVIDTEEQAVGLAEALLEGGIKVIEITLRNDFGVRAVALIKQQFPEMVVLAGTVNSARQMHEVAAVGVDGVISPGLTDSLLKSALEANVAYLPGVATASEVLKAMEYGLSECKLFPATVVGGTSALKAFKGPFPDIKFCPTGGVSADNYRDFLKLDNVMCVGGSWLAPGDLIKAQDWAAISQLCEQVTQ